MKQFSIVFKKINVDGYTTLGVGWRTCFACGYEGYFSARCPQCATVQ